MAIQIRAYTRRSKLGKTVKVSAHSRGGGRRSVQPQKGGSKHGFHEATMADLAKHGISEDEFKKYFDEKNSSVTWDDDAKRDNERQLLRDLVSSKKEASANASEEKPKPKEKVVPKNVGKANFAFGKHSKARTQTTTQQGSTQPTRAERIEDIKAKIRENSQGRKGFFAGIEDRLAKFTERNGYAYKRQF